MKFGISRLFTDEGIASGSLAKTRRARLRLLVRGQAHPHPSQPKVFLARGRELLQKYYRKLRVTAAAPTRTAAKNKIESVAEEILYRLAGYRLAGYRLREQETGYDRQIPAERVPGTAAAPPPVAPDALGRIGTEFRIKRERVPTREDEET